jgi:hypothetical protein
VNSAVADRCHRARSRLWSRIFEVVQRDPGWRALVMVRVERRHAVVEGLRHADEVPLVSVWMLPE